MANTLSLTSKYSTNWEIKSGETGKIIPGAKSSNINNTLRKTAKLI